jgi:hypothetical protein
MGRMRKAKEMRENMLKYGLGKVLNFFSLLIFLTLCK